MAEKASILLVDDEPSILSQMSRVLDNAGFLVHTCELWPTVFSTVLRVRPDLVLLDYNMPSIKGDELCEVLKRNNLHPGMKVVLFSNEQEPLLARRSIACGADGYLKKNQPWAKIVEGVHQLLGDRVSADRAS
jgi:CheY-like chemotaxis protein